jgi:D-glycerate 3-kinase
VMTDAQIARFIQHYERLTKHVLIEMPPRADLVIRLAEDRSVL